MDLELIRNFGLPTALAVWLLVENRNQQKERVGDLKSIIGAATEAMNKCAVAMEQSAAANKKNAEVLEQFMQRSK